MKAEKQSKLPPFCLRCDVEGDVWEVKKEKVEQTFRGETFHVENEITVCRHCGFKIVQDGQADALVRATWDAYREKRGLLTASEIVARRNKLGLSQQQFAECLGVGVASVKRWETGFVQDKSNDMLIRAKTDEANAATNVLFDMIFKGTPPLTASNFSDADSPAALRLELSRFLEENQSSNPFVQSRLIEFLSTALRSAFHTSLHRIEQSTGEWNVRPLVKDTDIINQRPKEERKIQVMRGTVDLAWPSEANKQPQLEEDLENYALELSA